MPGRFELTGIPAAPSGLTQVDVTFDIDVDGIMHLSAANLYIEMQAGINTQSCTSQRINIRNKKGKVLVIQRCDPH